MGNIISLVVLGVTFLMLLSGFLVGVIRGLRKSVHRVIWMAGILLICIIFVPIISNALFTAELPFFHLTVNETTVHSIEKFVRLSMSESGELARLVESKPEVVDAVLKIASLLLNSFLLVIVFWLLKIITLPIYAIIARNKKKDNIKHKHVPKKGELGLVVEVEEEAPPKRRLWGGLVGIGIAIIIISATFSPFVGIGMMLVQADNNIQVVNEETNQTQGFLENSMGEMGPELLGALENGIGTKVLTYTGVKYLSLGTFMSVTSTNVDGYKFSLYNEVNGLTSLAGRVLKYTNFDYSSITESQLDTLIVDADSIANSLFDSGLVSVFGHYFIPYFLEELSTNETFAPTGNEIADIAIRAALGELAKLDVKEYQGDLVKIVDVAEILNDGDFLYPAISGQLKTTNDYLNAISENMVNDVVSKVLSFSTISAVLPTAIDAGIDALAESLDINVTKYSGEFNDDARREFAQVLGNIYGIVKSLNFPDDDSEASALDMITKDTFVQMGQLLDSVKNVRYITTTTYNNILNKYKTEITNEINNNADISQTLKTSYVSIVNSIFDITSYETAFTKLGEVYEIVKPMVVDLQSKEEVGYNEISAYLPNIGKALDKLEGSGLIGSIDAHLSAFIDFAKDNFKQSMIDLGYLESEVNYIFNKIDTSQKAVVSYESEFTGLKGVLDVIFEFINDKETSFEDKLSDTEFLNNLGTAIDEYNKTGKILTTTNIVDILKVSEVVILSYIPSEYSQMQDIISQLIENASSITSWKSELAAVKTLFNYIKPVMESDDVFTSMKQENYLKGLGVTLDTIVGGGSKLVNNALVKEIMILGIDILSSQLPDIFGNNANAKNDMINNVKSITNISWEQELDALEELVKFDYSILNYSTYSGFKELGAVLDDVTANSQIFDYVVVKDMVDGAIENSLANMDDEDIIAFLNDGRVSLNSMRVQSWENELDGIAKLATFDKDSINLTTGAGLVEFGQLLDSIKGNVITNNTNITRLIARMVNKAKNDATDSVVSTLLSAMYETLQNKTVSNWTNEFNAVNVLLRYDRTSIDTVTASGLSAFGAVLDGVKNSVLLAPENINEMLNEIFEDIVNDNINQTTNPHIVNIYNELLTGIPTLGNGGENEYAVEFGYVEKMVGLTKNISLNNSAQIGITFDEIRTSKLVGNSGRYALYMVIEEIDISTAVTDMSEVKVLIKANVDTILSLTTYENPYTVIFSDLKTVADYISGLTSDGVDIESYDFVSTGTTLDSFEAKTTIGKDVTDIIAVEILTRISNDIDVAANPSLETAKTYVDGTILRIKADERTSTYSKIFSDINLLLNM